MSKNRCGKYRKFWMHLTFFFVTFVSFFGLDSTAGTLWSSVKITRWGNCATSYKNSGTISYFNNKRILAISNKIYGVDGDLSNYKFLPPGYCALYLNDSGLYVGGIDLGTSEDANYNYYGRHVGTFLGNVYTDELKILGTFGYVRSYPVGITNFGQLVVNVDNDQVSQPSNITEHRVLISAPNLGSLTDIGGLGGYNSLGKVDSVAHAINNLGQIVGSSLAPKDGYPPDKVPFQSERYLFRTGANGQGMTALLPKDSYGQAAAINDVGEIVGNGSGVPFYVGAGSNSIVALPGFSVVSGINNSSWIVGTGKTGTITYAAVKFPGNTGPTNINSIVSVAGGEKLTGVNALNDNGEMVVFGERSAYVLFPVPGPDIDVDKNSGPPCDVADTPNPINARTGNKYLYESDYLSGDGIEFSRYYNSLGGGFGGNIGASWRHSYSSLLSTSLIKGQVTTVVSHPNGTSTRFREKGGIYSPEDADVIDKLELMPDKRWQYTNAADDSVNVYYADGSLASITSRKGVVQTVAYNRGTSQIGLVQDSFGRTLSFGYDLDGNIISVRAPDESRYSYEYDKYNNLVSVTYPGGAKKIYNYNEPRNVVSVGSLFIHSLTSIVDENGARYADYYYDEMGRAISESHSGDVDQYKIDFGTAGAVSVTDPIGNVRTHSLKTILNVIKTNGFTQPAVSGSDAYSMGIVHDQQGNVTQSTNAKGVITKYIYDSARNLETSRIEAAGYAEERATTTQWHPTFHLPLKISEPLRITSFDYDVNGNLVKKTIQASSDATGAAGLSAKLVGIPRVFSYTYEVFGKLSTATGPRTDVAEVTRYSYDSSGNLIKIVNAAGQIVTLSNYDKNGRVGQVITAAGETLDITYWPRGWIKSINSAGELTTYEYDSVGQLTKLTQPDGVYIAYEYDNAHRLIVVNDSQKNSIHFDLDGLGNRISERVYVENKLVRQTLRTYDGLGRLQTQTGG